MSYKTQLTTEDFDRFDRPSKRDCTASTIAYIQRYADDGIVEYYECKNDWKELDEALKRGERPELVFVPFDSPEASKTARADIYVLFWKNGHPIMAGIECKSTGYPMDQEGKVKDGVYCGKNKIAFFRRMYKAYGIPYYWAELYNNEMKIRIWNLYKMGVLDGRELEDLKAPMHEITLDPNSPVKLTTKGGLPVEEATIIDRLIGENIYDQQRDSGEQFRINPNMH